MELSKDGNTVYHVPDITRTIIESQNADGKTDKTIIQNGYLDVGIMDTMKDLFVNFIGAVVFSVFGYLYSRNDYQNLRSSRILFLKNQTIKHAKNKRRGSDNTFVTAPSLNVWHAISYPIVLTQKVRYEE